MMTPPVSQDAAQTVPAPAGYLRLLERWYGSSEKWTHPFPDDLEPLAYFGVGDHGHWAVQANSTAFAAVAVMAASPELDERKAGLSREALRERALQMLRYLLATHHSGRIATVSGERWGHSWISVLALERLAHGVAALRPWLTAADRDRLRRVMISESDFLLGGFPVTGEIADRGHNHPESNIWCGSMLFRTAAIYPDAPHAAKYREMASSFFLNGISIPSDALSTAVFNGKALRDWHIGPNFTENYGLNHHGYLNLGYMVICLSNIAMLHYWCLDYGIIPPAELYHHTEDLWRLVKSLTFDDGRLWRIGGDTRVRYCYCQDYAVPAWVFARDVLGDSDAEKFLSGWIKLVAKEQGGNPDGGFLSSRLASLASVSPLYYCRLEGDRAASLSMAAYWSRQAGDSRVHKTIPALIEWHDDFHGAAMIRGKRLASWVWRSAQMPTGTVVPADRSDLAEWQWNLAGRVQGAGCMAHARLGRWNIGRFPGGFVNSGDWFWEAADNPAEGSKPEITARARIVFAALPDDATVLVLQQAQTVRPVYLNETAGLFLNVPNDLYNGGERIYRIGGADRKIAGAGGSDAPRAETIECGERLGIEGRIALQAIYGGELQLVRPGQRRVNLVHNVPLHYSGQGANLYADLVCMQHQSGQKFYGPNVLIYDIGAVLAVDSQPKALLVSGGETEKLIRTVGADNKTYLLAANFGAVPCEQALPKEANGAEPLSGPCPVASKNGVTLTLQPGEAALMRLAFGAATPREGFHHQ